ncbi:hypothetical protein Cci01nite_69300 [Catellatospora citrea]|uniref:Uncharacterized protein n=1 Tax=Catellatospora citrea TaxID=53366 RepID=A0A8J3KL63_9ACTN|nr:hypothetical protein Cci01nite_69300 [Catellatospora citrea]
MPPVAKSADMVFADPIDPSAVTVAVTVPWATATVRVVFAWAGAASPLIKKYAQVPPPTSSSPRALLISVVRPSGMPRRNRMARIVATRPRRDLRPTSE